MSLQRFHEAQTTNNSFETARKEIQDGRKRSHWIWYIFPQLRSSWTISDTAKKYAIADFEEALAFFNDTTLFERYQIMVGLVLQQLNTPGVCVVVLMGGDVDALKLASSLTLFEAVSARLSQSATDDKFVVFKGLCDAIFKVIEPQGFGRCKNTLEKINGSQPVRAKVPSTPTQALPPKEITPKKPENDLKNKTITILESYILMRSQEPACWYQGLFKGYSKAAKLAAARSFLSDLGVIQKDNKCVMTSDKYLRVISQGRLGILLKNIAKDPVYFLQNKTVGGLVESLVGKTSIYTHSA